MDSLTQITLGAAVGEILLGRKLGNKAMFWGALGGTLPDMDVLGNAFMSEVDSLVFHRGISHSIFFALVASLPMGLLMHWWYKQKWRSSPAMKWIKWSLYLLFFIGLVFGIYSITDLFQAAHNYIILILGSIIGFLIFRRYYLVEIKPPDPGYSVSFKEGYILFFWAIITHIALDVFTSYGTQVFKPFMDTRVAIGSISVVDFLYTVPFLLCLIGASFMIRTSRNRKMLVVIGVIISSTYLLFTVYNQQRVKKIFLKTLSEKSVYPDRVYVTPYIMNNVLWHCVAQIDDEYKIGAYSLFDKEKKVQLVTNINQNAQLLGELILERDVKILKWFSNGYYAVIKKNNELYLGDLRYGNGDRNYKVPSDYVFIFRLNQDDENLEVSTIRNRDNINGRMNELWSRIKGI